MNRETNDRKHQKSKIQRWCIVALLLMALSVGGVTAFLSTSDGPLTNTLVPEDEPIVAVNPGGSITIHDQGYWVYLRTNVVVNWVNTATNAILAQPPAASDYTLKVNDKWLAHTDGFYYYRAVIKDNGTYDAPVTITPEVEKTGYELRVTVLAQTVQAVGTTDAAPYKDAVEDAWGITAETITGTSGT